MATMLYKTPSKNKSCLGDNGFVIIDRVKFDYMIVEDKNIADCVSKGWLTAANVKPKPIKKKQVKFLLEG